MRTSGILLHITSLPSPGGIGTLGQEAYDFVDFLRRSGMRVWQMLPISPTGYADSPYQSVSTYAGNPLLIDARLMAQDGLLPPPQAEPEAAADAPQQAEGAFPLDRVDYGAVSARKTVLLKEAYGYSHRKLAKKLARFEKERFWVKDYALFCAIKEHFGLQSWMEWPDQDARMRRRKTLTAYTEQLSGLVGYYTFIQYVFFDQWQRLKKYANKQGISLFGDMPIYVAEDSADVWTNPQVFQLDENRRPTFVAGVPPDYFAENGQRWGNPLYNWDYLKQTSYAWWLQRLQAMGEYFDLLRVDHFIGFANYYSVPATEATARNGVWKKAPGRDFFKHVKKQLPALRIVAEDLGAVNDRVAALLAFCGYPGMKVLTFGFGGDYTNPHLISNYPANCVAYPGTHDNATALGWWQHATPSQRAFALKILHLKNDAHIAWEMVRAIMLCAADTAIAPMQDILELPDSARMNIPGTVGGNWSWRMLPDAANDALAGALRALNILAGRI